METDTAEWKRTQLSIELYTKHLAREIPPRTYCSNVEKYACVHYGAPKKVLNTSVRLLFCSGVAMSSTRFVHLIVLMSLRSHQHTVYITTGAASAC